MKIAISETFYSIQGEGIHCGTPAIFIRFHGCQLRCAWCDTSYALDPDDTHQNIEVDALINSLLQWPCKHVVITGGDPSFQARELDMLSSQLVVKEYSLEMETNGIKLLSEDICDRFETINVGLKLPSEEHNFADNYYRNAVGHYGKFPQSYFKFVITNLQDAVFIKEQIQAKTGLLPGKILLMPLGETISDQNARASEVIQICKREGYRFSPRLHIMFGVR